MTLIAVFCLIQMNENHIPLCTFAALESKRRSKSKTETFLHMFLRFEGGCRALSKRAFDDGCWLLVAVVVVYCLVFLFGGGAAADLKALAEGKRFSGRTKWQG